MTKELLNIGDLDSDVSSVSARVEGGEIDDSGQEHTTLQFVHIIAPGGQVH